MPAEVRKTLGLNENDVLDVGFSISEKVVVLRKNDSGGVAGSIADCGSAGPDSISGQCPKKEGDYG